MSAPVLELRGVVKEFASGSEVLRVLDGVDLSIKAGETLAVAGPSGSGKSTLLGIMAGLERPTSGSVLRDGRDAARWSEDEAALWRRRRLGFVFQTFRLVPTLSALENASLPLELLGARPADAEEQAAALLGTLGLGGRLSHRPAQLSGGEQQRVAIARAYVHKPALILADEPTGSLDRATAERVLAALLELNARAGTALAVVTHDPAVAEALGRTARLERGRVAA
ncbi:MAG: ABC transporter ATP-binding protein [Elusimicrobiota bacterium]|nr:MAG: ABC transporter ATP-binding protein [Elusimicrobiota bacterium]